MKCEACGGGGLIEVGAYRGDESDATTRECRLRGGAVTINSTADVIARLGFSAESAAQVLTRLGEAGKSPLASVLPWLVESTAEIMDPAPDVKLKQNAHGFYESKEAVPLPMRSDNTEDIRFERTTSARNADDEMNKFLRDNLRD